MLCFIRLAQCYTEIFLVRIKGRPGQVRRQAGGGQVRRAAPQQAARVPAGGAAQGEESQEAELGEQRRLRGPRHRALHAQLRPGPPHARRQPREGPQAEAACCGERGETRGSDDDGKL